MGALLRGGTWGSDEYGTGGSTTGSTRDSDGGSKGSSGEDSII